MTSTLMFLMEELPQGEASDPLDR